MLDLNLASSLFGAIRKGTRLLLVGDVDQLPSVGAGNVLRDIISSGTAKVARLNTIYRQAEDSQIITNAHLINHGKMPVFDKESKDFFLFSADTAEKAADWVVDLVSKRIPSKFGLNPLRDIQVLAPTYRGPAGVIALNLRLQEILNPDVPGEPETHVPGSSLRKFDKVVVMHNDYEKEISNGDSGYIAGIDMDEQTFTVNFDGRMVEYDWEDAGDLSLEYAITVHKSQGSEFPVMVMPVIEQQYMMLQRNLLYTAVTRAKSKVVLAGSLKAIGIAVGNNHVNQRYSGLRQRLEKAFEGAY